MKKPSAYVRKRIVDCVKAGRPVGVCCRAHEIDLRDHERWMRESEDEDCNLDTKVYAHEVRAAEAGVEASIIDELRQHTHSDWKAADRLLKILNPNEYVEESKIKISGRVDNTVKHVVELDAGALSELAALMSSYKGSGMSIGGVPLDDVIDGEIVDVVGEIEETTSS